MNWHILVSCHYGSCKLLLVRRNTAIVDALSTHHVDIQIRGEDAHLCIQGRYRRQKKYIVWIHPFFLHNNKRQISSSGVQLPDIHRFIMFIWKNRNPFAKFKTTFGRFYSNKQSPCVYMKFPELHKDSFQVSRKHM